VDSRRLQHGALTVEVRDLVLTELDSVKKVPRELRECGIRVATTISLRLLALSFCAT
jgi:hypothetical protein